MGSLFFFPFPAELSLTIAGPEETKNLAGRNVLRLIQIRIATSSLEEISSGCQDNSPQTPNRRFQFHKSSQLFIRTHNETLSVVAVRVGNEDRSPVRIDG
jgi:hypothetical protein